MGLLDEYLQTPDGQAMQFKPAEPDPTTKYKDAAMQQQANFLLAHFRGERGNEMPKSWEELKGVDDRKAERAAAEKAELAAAAAAVAEHKANVAALAEAQKQLGAAKSKARIARVDAYMRERGQDPNGPDRPKAIAKMNKKGLL